MSQVVTVLLVCPAGLLRESICDCLDGTAYFVTPVESLREIAGRTGLHFDVGLYVSPETRAVTAAHDAGLIERVDVTNWLVLSDRRDNPVYARLMHDHMPACAVPLEVSRQELPHLVILATRSRRLCIQAQCDACPSSTVHGIVGANLDERQWQLMRYLSEGLSNKEIARIEDCTEGNVKVRIRTLLDRLHASNRTQAAVMAARAGLRYEHHRPMRAPVRAMV